MLPFYIARRWQERQAGKQEQNEDIAPGANIQRLQSNPKINLNRIPGGGIEVVFCSGRNLLSTVPVLVLWLAAGGCLIALAAAHRIWAGVVVFCLMESWLASRAIRLWCEAVFVQATSAGMTVRRSWLGFSKTFSIPRSDVQEIAAEPITLPGNADRYKIQVSNPEATIVVAIGIKGEADARFLAEQIRAAIQGAAE
jgi:hypothetical protein